MRFNHAVLALAVIASACSSDAAEPEEPWSFDENSAVGENNASNSTGNNSIEPNNATSNNINPNNVNPNNVVEDPPDCVDFDVATFEAQVADPGAYPLVDDGEVYVTQYAPGSGAMWIVRWDGESLVPVPIGTDSAASAVAAEDGNVWFVADERLGRYRAETQETEIFAEIPIDVSVGDFDTWAQPRHTARGGSLAFKHEGSAFVSTDGSLEALGPITWASQPWLGERGVSWWFLTDATGGNLRHVGDGLDITLQDVGGTLSWPVTTDKWLFYIHDGRVMALELGGDVEPFDVGIDAACGPLYTDGTTVVTACNSNWFEGPTPPPPPTDYLSLSARQIWVIDTETIEPLQILQTEDRAVHFPMVNERWVAWVEYTPDVGAPTEPSGQIRVLPRGSINGPVDIAEMGYGCPYCGAYWPAPRLVLDDDTLAWNYAISSDGDYRSRIGVAQLRCP